MNMKPICMLLISVSPSYAYSETVTMAFGEAIPPFSFPESNRGIEIEVIGEALAIKGHQLKPEYFPLARVPVSFKHKEVQAAMTDLGQDMSQFGAFYGNTAVIYDNVFISLKERHLEVSKPEDLKGLSVVSFQGAIKRYPEWLTPVEKLGQYYEQNNQQLQVITLQRGRYDLVLSDINIFKYFLLQGKEQLVTVKPIQIHRFVEVNPDDYRPVFWSKSIRDDFNEGLNRLKESGRYKAIYDKYLME